METRLREPSKDRRSRDFSRRLQDPLLAALVTAVIYWTVMLLGKYVPFGINTPAVTDAKLQYLDLFAYCRDVLTGQNSAVYTFSNTLGGGAAAIWAYYLASPFNLLLLLFPKDQMNLFLEVLITAKLSAASASFAWLIGRRFKQSVSRDMTLLLSVAYGLMQYMLAQESNVMWLDGVILLPFIVMGIHRAVYSRRFALAELAVPAAASVLANWYTGGINYLFSAVWFLYELLRDKRSGKPDDPGSLGTARRIGRYLLGMGTGLLLAAVLFLPNVIALRQGKAGSWNPMEYGLSAGFRGNPFSVIRSYRIGEMSDISRASFFCGTPAAFGTAAYFPPISTRRGSAGGKSWLCWCRFSWPGCPVSGSRCSMFSPFSCATRVTGTDSDIWEVSYCCTVRLTGRVHCRPGEDSGMESSGPLFLRQALPAYFWCWSHGGSGLREEAEAQGSLC